MFGAYVRENRKVVIALAVYTAVFAFIFWLYRLPLGAVGYAALVCLFLLLVWLAVDYRRFAVRLRLLRRLEQEITLSTEQLPEPDGALEAQYQALGARARCRPPRTADAQPAGLSGPGGVLHRLGAPNQNAHRRHAPAAAGCGHGRAARPARAAAERGAVCGDGARLSAAREPVVGLCYPQLRARRYRPAGGAQVCLAVHPAQAASGVYAAERQRHHGREVAAVVIEQVLSNALKYTRAGQCPSRSRRRKRSASATRASASRPEDLPARV